LNTDLVVLKKNTLNKQIYIKTEPGGKIVFGRLNSRETKILLRAIKLKKIPETLLELRTSNNSNFKAYEGVVNNGEDGDWGNEGVIKIHSEDAIELHKDTRGEYRNGAYLVYLSLSKVSIDFVFKLQYPLIFQNLLNMIFMGIRLLILLLLISMMERTLTNIAEN
jgi:hypothetical protein